MICTNTRGFNGQEFRCGRHLPDHVQRFKHFVGILCDDRSVQMPIWPEFGNDRRFVSHTGAAFLSHGLHKGVINFIYHHKRIFR